MGGAGFKTREPSDLLASMIEPNVGYANAGKIMVAYYDHGLKKPSIPQVVHDTGQHDTSQDDDHIAPSILILPDGYLLEAIVGYPLNVKSLVCLILTLLGQHTYRMAVKSYRKLRGLESGD